MKKSLGGFRGLFPGGRILLGLFFLLSLSSCGMGGGGAGGSTPPSSTFSAPSGSASLAPFGKIAIDHNNNAWVTTNTGLMEINAGATSCATASSCEFINLSFSPAGIAVDSGNDIWVTGNGDVTEVLCTSTPCKTFSGFTSPTGIAVDSQNTIWVTDTPSGSVTKIPFTSNTYPSSCSSSSCPTFSGSPFSSPIGIAVDSNNNVWVTNDTSSGSVTEIPFSTASSFSSTSCSSSSSCPTYSGFSNPVAVSLTGSTPWIANSGTGGSYPQAIVEIISSCTSSGCPNITHFTQPVGLAFDSSGNLWVIDAGNNSISEITLSALSSANCSPSTPCYQYSLPATPEGIATDTLGNVWVSLQNAQVIEYKP